MVKFLWNKWLTRFAHWILSKRLNEPFEKDGRFYYVHTDGSMRCYDWSEPAGCKIWWSCMQTYMELKPEPSTRKAFYEAHGITWKEALQNVGQMIW